MSEDERSESRDPGSPNERDPEIAFLLIVVLGALVLAYGILSQQLLLAAMLFVPVVGLYLLLRVAVALERIADAVED